MQRQLRRPIARRRAARRSSDPRRQSSSSRSTGGAPDPAGGQCGTEKPWRALAHGGASPAVRVGARLSSQTGRTRRGSCRYEDIPAGLSRGRPGTMMTCSAPADCARIERGHASNGLLVNGGASRGNLLWAEDAVLYSHGSAEWRRRRSARTRRTACSSRTRFQLRLWCSVRCVGGHLSSPLGPRLRAEPAASGPARAPWRHLPDPCAVLCARVVRDLIILRRPHGQKWAYRDYAGTFSSYDEGRAPFGLERGEDLLGGAAMSHSARAHRPGAAIRLEAVLDIAPLSRPGPRGATFKQRRNKGLDELVERSGSKPVTVPRLWPVGTSSTRLVGLATVEADPGPAGKAKKAG